MFSSESIKPKNRWIQSMVKIKKAQLMGHVTNASSLHMYVRISLFEGQD